MRNAFTGEAIPNSVQVVGDFERGKTFLAKRNRSIPANAAAFAAPQLEVCRHLSRFRHTEAWIADSKYKATPAVLCFQVWEETLPS